MDAKKAAEKLWRKVRVWTDCRGWEVIALVFVLRLLAAWHPDRPAGRAIPPSGGAPDVSKHDEQDRNPPVNLLDCDFNALSVELSLMTNRQARRQFDEWLVKRGLPKIEVPRTLFGKQEAITRAGQRKIGLFVLPPGAENYRFWTDPGRRVALPRGEEHISRTALEAPPGTPRYLAWAEEYNVWVAKLLGGPATLSDWQRFADNCEVWQRQFAAYREKWGANAFDRSLGDWRFAAAAATARNIVHQWAQYQQICVIGGAHRPAR